MTHTLDLESISLEWEKQTGYDSIATIKRIYDRTTSGAYKCIWPGCEFARKDAAKLWGHVHMAHGASSLPTVVGGADEAEAARDGFRPMEGE